jgi:DNA-binding MarR family transcriptional regulator
VAKNARKSTARAKAAPAKNAAVAADIATLHSRKPLAEVLGERKVAGLHVNLDSMALVSNIHRASAAIRDHFERFVLTEADLHWSAFVALWCLWIYGELETRRLAAEAGVAKSTLSGILNTLEARKLVKRRTNEAERRLVIVNLTPSGNTLITSLFPRFNGEETRIVGGLPQKQRRATTDALRAIIATIDEIDGPLRDDE